MPGRPKRKRTDSVSAPEDSKPVITRSTTWMSDGDVILQAESTQFRINKDVLRRHSPVFESMFSLPLPKDEPTIEGCPVVCVEDSAQDWELFLETLYDPFKHTHLWPFNIVAAMLRLGTKYQMESARNNAVSRLRRRYHTTLAGWALTEPILTESDEFLPLRVLQLVYECDVQTCIPSVAYECLEDWTLAELLDDRILDATGQAIVLSPHIKRLLAVGFERLTAVQRRQHLWLGTEDVVPTTTCESKASCIKRRGPHLQKLLQMAADTQGVDVFRPWTLPKSLCSRCDRAAQAEFNSQRKKAWEGLPGCFDLPAWSELHDGDKTSNADMDVTVVETGE
ncbi:BTB domain-containing protein [Mycena indigotica]|uniref:BTB domain-containing protein n=1 Tax=Mycena indigotica TaxID=2126181 RepID=A0A8H6TG45_9AGAR|nr:BTB domain-containing protein [Mycena indigotica]KAF7316046.1 BTB domain-containing protein [Mycena indigotica]